MIKVIGFDLGGVYLTDCWSKIVREKISEKFNISKEKLEEKNIEFEQDITEGKISEADFLKNLINDDEKTIEGVKQLIRSLNKAIFPEILELMKKLKQNYKLVLVNNEGKEWNDFRVKRFDLYEVFDEILTSCIIKDSKPKISYFEKVLKKLNLDSQQVLFIDDKLENVESARKIGIMSIHFKNPIQLKEELSRLKIKF